ncbi:MAG: arsenical efflux pump membrane protein ArsB [Aquificaceae bacterium]|nr:arsenical efflux pump membrane protein ArsB [Aquificaceae bacterium]MCS7277307.1 arsenical efflux pump membrane protein ArsB [Aquificaceae bacterium]MDW8422938.1 arsenical efflux pump membrane protein ArsB [Aquificaceae bacterium]
MDSFLPVLVFSLTLLFVLLRPFGLGIGWSAWLGAVACLLLGLISVKDILYITSLVWDATLAFILLIFVSIILDKVGFFEWIALKAIKGAKGRGYLLFVYLMLLGAFISAVFANDGASLMLTPIIYAKIKHLNLPRKFLLPYIMGSGFMADTASLPLVISNLTNIITAQFFGIGFGTFALYMFLPNLTSVLSSLLVLYLFYRKDLIKSYNPEILQTYPPHFAIRDSFVFKVGWLCVVLLAIILLFLEFLPVKLPVSALLGSIALLLALSTLKNKSVSLWQVLRFTPWHVVFFSVGMYSVVYSLKLSGLMSLVSVAIVHLYRLGDFYALLGTGLISAFMSAVMNNLPTVMVMNIAIEEAQLENKLTQFLALANLVGTNIGPKLTPIGSLATLLWLHVLEHKGIRIDWLYYTKVGFVITLPVLLATLMALWLVYFLSV